MVFRGRFSTGASMRTFGALLFLCLAAGAASAEERGVASYYLNPRAPGLTAAHRSLPLGSSVRVVNLANGRSVVVKIVDRGPFVRGRVIDVSTAAAGALGFRARGLTRVRLERD
jgi:rare lipoprotein A